MLAALRPILFKPAAAVSYDADAAAYFAAVATAGGAINAAGKTAYNDYIVGLKAAGIWAVLDRRWCWAAQDSIAALMCLKSLNNATAVNAPTHTAKVGYDFNGTTQYIDSGFDLSTGTNYTLNAAHAALWILDNVANNGIDLGVVDGDDYSLFIQTRRLTSTLLTTNVNSDSGGFTLDAQATSVGLSMAVRTGNTTAPRYKNGVAQTSDTITTATGVPTGRTVFFAASNSGSAGGFSTRAQAMASLGGILDATMAATDYTLTAAFIAAMAAS